jgi:adenylosuccinate synthase
MAVDILLGLQWGDEGKGKIVDVLTGNYDTIARFQGGPNAGHTLEFEGRKHVLHTIPSGIFHEGVNNVVGNGVVIDPIIFREEIRKLEEQDKHVTSRLFISRKAHLILPTHRILDAASEASKGKKKIGSTLKGIGPTYMDKTGRNGIRVGDIELDSFNEKYTALKNKHDELIKLYDYAYDITEQEAEWLDAVDYLRGLNLLDNEDYFQRKLKKGSNILAEGAQGTLLDVDFGSYPFVTSSTTTAAGACTGLGIPPRAINNVFGIFKAYCTRVGSGPFPTELHNETGQYLRDQGNEYGSTTGRPRRCGWLDLPALKYAININGVTELMMMKADVLSGLDKLLICTHYTYKGQQLDYLPYRIDDGLVEPVFETLAGWEEDLTQMKDKVEFPDTFVQYIKYIERATETPIRIVSVGPDRAQTITWKD